MLGIGPGGTELEKFLHHWNAIHSMSLAIARSICRNAKRHLSYTVNGILHLNVNPKNDGKFSYNKIAADAGTPTSTNSNELPDVPLVESSCINEPKEFAAMISDLYEMDGERAMGMGEFDTNIVFGGYGNPLSNLSTISDTVKIVRETSRHGVGFGVITDGKIGAGSCSETVDALLSLNIKDIEIGLISGNPKLYAGYTDEKSQSAFNDVISFVTACVENELNVTCGVFDESGGKLARALGAVQIHRYYENEAEGRRILIDDGEGGGRGGSC